VHLPVHKIFRGYPCFKGEGRKVKERMGLEGMEGRGWEGKMKGKGRRDGMEREGREDG
jgi:hypothetical protein